jgi:hypothetical protein
MQKNKPISEQAVRFILVVAIALIFPAAVIGRQAVVEERARGRLVSGFPPLPMYPGATVEESERRTQGDRTGFEAELISSDPVTDVYSFYLEALKRDGWDISFASENSATAEEQGLGAVKNGMRLYIEFEMEDDGRTEIEIEIPLQKAASGA